MSGSRHGLYQANGSAGMQTQSEAQRPILFTLQAALARDARRSSRLPASLRLRLSLKTMLTCWTASWPHARACLLRCATSWGPAGVYGMHSLPQLLPAGNCTEGS